MRGMLPIEHLAKKALIVSYVVACYYININNENGQQTLYKFKTFNI